MLHNKAPDVLSNKIKFSEVKAFLQMVFPLALSTGIDAILGFTDRLFLSHYKAGEGEVYLNASLIASLCAFVIISFFVVSVEYVNPMVSQYRGAGKIDQCYKVVSQAIVFAVVVYPFILILGLLAPKMFVLFKHSPLQLQLETTYVRIVLFGAIFSIIRSALGGFFVGINKVKVVMFANIFAALINIPLNYVLIFGKGIFPELGIAGAAYASVISGMCALIMLLCIYWSKQINIIYKTRQKIIFDKKKFTTLIKHGSHIGMEVSFGEIVFTAFMLAMSTYGTTVSSAVSIVVSWDTMIFTPMEGVYLATSAMIGKYIGAKNIAEAKKIVKISVSTTLIYMGVVIIFMLSIPHVFVNIFTSKMAEPQVVQNIAIMMLRFLCLYLLFDAILMSMYGVLSGAGDTKIITIIFICIDIVFFILLIILVFPNRISAMGAWFVFIGFAISLGVSAFLRYAQGHWQKCSLVD